MMNLSLFFRSTNLKESSSSTKFFGLFLLALLLIPAFFNASELENDNLEQGSKEEIIVSGNAIVYGEANIYNAKIVKFSEPTEEITSKKVLVSKTENSKVATFVKKKTISKKLTKPSTPKFEFSNRSSSQDLGVSTSFRSKTMVFNPTIVVGNFIICHYTKLSIASYVYLLNTYSADFSKTAELSQFLFSRPPPIV